jgi:hypothetical protein
MRFTLEALEAGPGDSLIVHYGHPPRFIVVDGGTPPTYKKVLGPRLQALAAVFADQDTEKLLIDLLVISHIDGDHIGGVIGLLREMQERQADGATAPYLLQSIWHNSFDDLIGGDADAVGQRLATTANAVLAGAGGPGMLPLLSAGLVASIPQGREVHRLARQLAIPLNSGFEGLVVAREGTPPVIEVAPGLHLRVLGPTERRVRALQRDWERYIRRLDDGDVAQLAAFVDRSVSNLSSIVVLLEAGGAPAPRRILLTGDARGDDVLAMIRQYGLADASGVLHVDVFKVPHHGSDRNSAPELFAAVQAEHYVISANGQHGNPDPPVVKWILESRAGKPCRIHLTNATLVDPKTGHDIAPDLKQVLTDAGADPDTIAWPSAGQTSVMVDLGDQVVDY